MAMSFASIWLTFLGLRLPKRLASRVVYLVLKKVGRGKSSGFDGLPYEMYLRLAHIIVTILKVVFNNWFR